MTTFDKREEGFEKKFALDEELRSRRTPAATRCSACGRRRSSASPAPRPTPMPRKSSWPTSRRAGDDDVFQQAAQGFRRQRRGAIGSPDPPHHGRADGGGDRSRSRLESKHPPPAMTRRLRREPPRSLLSCRCNTHGQPFPDTRSHAACRRRDGLHRLVRPRLADRRRDHRARRLSRRHHRPAARPVGHGGDGRRDRRDPRGRRRADRARAARRLRDREPRARFRRRGRDRPDDQHRRGCARLRGRGQVSAARRAQLGPGARDHAHRHHRS